jgi:hypothetical protein
MREPLKDDGCDHVTHLGFHQIGLSNHAVARAANLDMLSQHLMFALASYLRVHQSMPVKAQVAHQSRLL